MEEKMRVIPAESTPKTLSENPDGLVLNDEILIMKDEIASEAEKIAGQEIGKKQTSATACEILKKELTNQANQSYNKRQHVDKSTPQVSSQAEKAFEEANWFEQ